MEMENVAEDTTQDVPGYRTIVYQYGVSGLKLPGKDLPRELITEIELGHRLRNDLVELEKDRQARIAEIWEQFPEVAQSVAEKEAAEELAAQLATEIKEARQKARSAKIDPATREALKAARAELTRLRAHVREVKSVAYARAKPLMEEAGKDHQRAVKGLYRKYIDQGMYWASWNDVVAHHKTAMDMIARARKEGRPADIRFHRFDGTGTATVQPQRSVKDGDPPRTPDLLASGSPHKWSNVLKLSPWMPPEEFSKLPAPERRRLSCGTLTIRVGSGDKRAMVTLPVRIHRMMPAEADIVLVRVTRRRIGTQYRSKVSITVRVPAVPMRTQGPLAAVHLGWRVLEDGAIRVAVIKGTTTPLPVYLKNPDKHANGPVVRGHGTWSEVVVPPSWREVYQVPARVRGQRDRNLEDMRSWLKRFTEEHPAAAEAICPAEEIARRRSPTFYSGLANVLRQEHEDRTLDPELREAYEVLWAWRRQDRHLLDWEANERDQFVGRRDYAWRVVAAWLCEEAAVVVADEWAVAPLARVPALGQEEDGAAAQARANRVVAAPGRLREFVEGAASMRGARVVRPGARVSETHHVCGTRFSGDQDTSLMLWCDCCQLMVDQDYNSLENMLEWGRTGSVRTAASIPVPVG